MSVLDFFKNKPQDGDDQGVVTPPAPVVSSTTTSSVSSAPQSFNGIGTPPAGQSFNGIGTPPTGQSFNGIGTPTTPAPVQPITSAQAPVPMAPATPTPLQPLQTGSAPVPSTPPTSPTTPAQTPATPAQNSPVTSSTPAQSTDTPQLNTDGSDKNATDKRGQIDLMTHLTQRSNAIFVSATQKAQELQSEFVDSEHVLHGLLADPEIYKLFTDNKIQPQIIEQELESVYKKGQAPTQPQPSPRVKRILDNAMVVARKLGYEFISPEHILLSLFEEGEGAGARVLTKLGVKKEDLNKKITGKKEGLSAEGKESDGKAQSVLAQYTNDLTAKAESGQLDPVVERSEVIERAIHIISRRTKNNPVLVGEAGVGKTAIVEGLAQKIVSKEVPESLIGKRILQLDLMAILAGASHRGEFEERMKKVIEEIVASNGSIILFIDEIHNIVGAGSGGNGSLDASNFLKPSLARGELQMIGATTLTEYRKYIEKDPALERRFQPVLTPEPEVEPAIKMLKALKGKYEAFHRVQIPDATIEVAVKLSKRFVGDRFLPDKAIDLIDEAASAVRLPLISLPEEIRSHEDRLKQLKQELDEVEKRGDKVKAKILQPKIDDLETALHIKQDEYNDKKSQTTTSVTEQAIKDVISRWTGIPVSKLSDSDTEKLTNLEDIIHKRLINQTHAVEPVAQAVRRGRAGLKSTNRPIGSFVFLGPTGVGKTELSKTLAEVLFGQEEAMIRFDMTEYMEKHEVAKLLGAPPGYVGYEEGGKLTEAVRRRPYAVVLFDEIEKAHPDIFNILLQVLDDGRLTDNKGHVVSFKNTVVICTSNIGTKLIQDEILAQGSPEIEEPTVLTTYTFSPRGRQIMTIMGKVFERESKEQPWANMMLLDYFAGQKIQEKKTVSKPDGTQEVQEVESAIQFPGKNFDTHAMSPQGVEMITSQDRVYQRTSTTAKVWNTLTLIDYFKDGVVINALPDAPEQQLPTARLKSHTFNSAEEEIVTLADRYWTRKGAETNWKTGLLKEYFAGHTCVCATLTPAQPQQSQPQQVKTDQSQPDTQNKQQGGEAQKTANSPAKPAEQEKAILPTNYWDIHFFTPEGVECIIVGDKIWSRKAQATEWLLQTLHEYFGADFPLEKEIAAKEQIEEELATNQYGKIKTKVMGELSKFFRPELINRFDEVIIFEPLKYKHMLQIAELQLKGITKLLEEQNIGFTWSEAAKKEIVRQGFDAIYGARPLKRAIQKLIENPISTLIIEKKIDESDSLMVDFDGDTFIFNIEHVSFEPVKEAPIKAKKSTFTCSVCSTTFDTVIAPASTPICPKDGSNKVTEKKPEPPQSNNSEPEQKQPVQDQKKPELDQKKPVIAPAKSDSTQPAPTMPSLNQAQSPSIPPRIPEPTQDSGQQLQPSSQ